MRTVQILQLHPKIRAQMMGLTNHLKRAIKPSPKQRMKQLQYLRLLKRRLPTPSQKKWLSLRIKAKKKPASPSCFGASGHQDPNRRDIILPRASMQAKMPIWAKAKLISDKDHDLRDQGRKSMNMAKVNRVQATDQSQVMAANLNVRASPQKTRSARASKNKTKSTRIHLLQCSPNLKINARLPAH